MKLFEKIYKKAEQTNNFACYLFEVSVGSERSVGQVACLNLEQCQ